MTKTDEDRYRKEVRSAVREYINSHIDMKEWNEKNSREILKQYLFDELVYKDSVTEYMTGDNDIVCAKCNMLFDVISDIVDKIK